jgi:hypothetical protein
VPWSDAGLYLGFFRVARADEHPRQGWCTVNVPDHDVAESDPRATTLGIYRESLPNDRSMFNALIVDWSALSPAHRALVYKIGDRLAKRRGVAKGVK